MSERVGETVKRVTENKRMRGFLFFIFFIIIFLLLQNLTSISLTLLNIINITIYFENLTVKLHIFYVLNIYVKFYDN